jgi:predicted signal transduction protein with EAL and GGDEF domain
MTRLDLNVKISLIVSLLMIVILTGLGIFLHAYFVAEANPPVIGNVNEEANYLEVCAAAKGEGEADARAFAAGIREVLAGTREKFSMEYPCHAPFTRRWFVGRVTRFDGNGAVRVVVAHEDITERVLSEEQILVMAYHDALTGLPNRLLLQDRLQQALAHAGRNNQLVGVMYLDIDHFKHLMKSPLRLAEQEVSVSTSIGVALYPRDAEGGEMLLKFADFALYEAKQKGRNQLCFYEKR